MSAVDVLAKYAEQHGLPDAFCEAISDVAELIEANSALIEEWDRQDDGRSKFDPMPAKDWFAAEARFRAAIARCAGEGA